MGKRQRDCVECDGPVGIIGRDLCCRCTARAKDAAAKQPCPDCSRSRVLVVETGRCVLCSRRCAQCGHKVRFAEAVLCGAANAKPTCKLGNRTVRGAANPGICAWTPAGAVTVRGRDLRRSPRASASPVACCAAMPAAACARDAGSAIRIGRMWPANIS